MLPGSVPSQAAIAASGVVGIEASGKLGVSSPSSPSSSPLPGGALPAHAPAESARTSATRARKMPVFMAMLLLTVGNESRRRSFGSGPLGPTRSSEDGEDRKSQPRDDCAERADVHQPILGAREPLLSAFARSARSAG